MSDMRKEVDYRLAKILCADMCAKGLIQSEKEKDEVNHSMLEQFAPPFASLEQEIPIQLSKDDFSKMLGTKLRCEKCGRAYGIRPWHSTTTHDLVYDCLSRTIRHGFCGNSHIYLEFMPVIAGSMVRLLIKNRHIAEQFIVKMHRAFSQELLTEVQKYLGFIISGGNIEFTPEWENLHYVISELVVNGDVINIQLTDGSAEEFILPKFTPKLHRREM